MKVLLLNHHYYLHEIADYRWTGTVLKGLADQQFLLVVYFIPVFPIVHFHLGGNPRCTHFMFQVNLKKRALPFCCEFFLILRALSRGDTGVPRTQSAWLSTHLVAVGGSLHTVKLMAQLQSVQAPSTRLHLNLLLCTALMARGFCLSCSS